MKRIHFPLVMKKIVVGGAFFAMAITAVPFYAAASSTMMQTAIDFTGVAKEATPAVVSIKVKTTPKKQNFRINPWSRQEEDNQDDMFGNDFFRRFFSIPYGQEQDSTPSEGQASGFIVSSDGILITNSHVVSDASEITVVLNDGREFAGKVIGHDPNTDIAVVKIDAKDLPYVKLGNSDNLLPGQWAIAVGNPLGLQATLTVGVISATGRNNLDITRIEDFIQTDAAINRGNSGGPLLNIDGDVIGMNTAIVTNYSTGGYMGIGFAIPSNMIKHVMDELIQDGQVTRGFLGIVMQQMDANLAKAFKLTKPEGALIAEVAKDSPAEKAGIKQGDIVLKYNNSPVNNIAALRNAVALMKPGTMLNLSLLREGSPMEIAINIGAFPKDGEVKTSSEPKETKYGFGVQDLTPDLAQTLGYKGEKGVVITTVNSNGPAAWAGLRKGTLILAANQSKVSTVEEFNRAVDAIQPGAPLLLLVKQSDNIRFVSLQVN